MKPKVYIDAPDIDVPLTTPNLAVLPRRGDVLRLNGARYTVLSVEWAFETANNMALSPRVMIYTEPDTLVKRSDVIN